MHKPLFFIMSLKVILSKWLPHLWEASELKLGAAKHEWWVSHILVLGYFGKNGIKVVLLSMSGNIWIFHQEVSGHFADVYNMLEIVINQDALAYFNSLAPGKFEWNFTHVIFKWILVIDVWGISCEIALIWMSLDFTDDQSKLVQVMPEPVLTQISVAIWHH